MKYEVLKPEDVLQKGDEYILKYSLVNFCKPTWTPEIYSLGKKVSDYPDHIFRRPVFEPRTFDLNERYTAVIHRDKVSVACQNFTFSSILALAELIQQIQREAKNV